ncbi:uncharacterized protein [Arachis hypogaea]|uniref:uncharacterized protein n=1 Tax=Arachis hypogaea TaxID=3818 RepID=UPI003B215A22
MKSIQGSQTAATLQTMERNWRHEDELVENWRGVIVVRTRGGATGGGSESGILSRERKGERVEERRKGSKDAEVTLMLGNTEDKREQYRLMRDAMKKRFIRVTLGSIVGGVRLGMFTAAFYGFQNILAEQRGVHDVFNVVGAGSATTSAFGLICKK